ncbi:MAG: caspase family protein, partial [Candidatus Brocadiae bacterium]|nr:caspase family protein [Candidatus Brocadiia bacterium]
MKRMLVLLLLCWIQIQGQVWVEKELKEAIQTPNPYPNQVSNDPKYTWEIEESQAEEMQVYIEYLDLEENYDYLDAYGKEKKGKGQRLTGQKREYWSESIQGNAMRLRLTSDESGSGKGFKITKYRYKAARVVEKIKGKIWAVVIGNSKYTEDYKELKMAAKDAKEVRQYLLSPEGLALPEENVYPESENVGYEKFRESYERWLKTRVEEEDRVLFYYAGHGDVEEEGKKAYLIPSDARQSKLWMQGIELSSLKKSLWDLKAKQVLLVLDSCYSGTALETLGGELKRAAPGKAKDLSKIELKKREELPPGRMIMTSCQAEEQAIELERYRQGAFTFYFLQGISGGADYTKDGYIDVGNTYSYLKEKVEDLAKKYKHKQTPQLAKRESEERFYLRVPDHAKPVQLILEEPKELKEEDYYRTEKSQLTIKGRLRYGAGIEEVKAGSVYEEKGIKIENRGKEGVVFETEIELRKGRNVYWIEAKEKTGEKVKRDFTIHREEDELISLEIEPESMLLDPGQKKKVEAVAIYKSGKREKGKKFVWRAQHGSIDEEGIYTAPTGRGEDRILLKTEDNRIKKYAQVQIKTNLSQSEFWKQDFMSLKQQGYFSSLPGQYCDVLQMAKIEYRRGQRESAILTLQGLMQEMGTSSRDYAFVQELCKGLMIEEIQRKRADQKWQEVIQKTEEYIRQFQSSTELNKILEEAQKENISPRARTSYDEGIAAQVKGRWEQALSHYNQAYPELNSHYRELCKARQEECRKKAMESHIAAARESFEKEDWIRCEEAIASGLKHEPQNIYLKLLSQRIKTKLEESAERNCQISISGEQSLEESQEKEYQIIVSNQSQYPVSGLMLKSVLPEAMSYQGRTNQSLQWNLDIPARSTRKVSFQAKAERQGYYTLSCELYSKGKSIQSQSLSISIKKGDDTYGLPAQVWNNCKYNHNGEWILDMASDYWGNLSVSEQQRYAKAYQEGYARKKRLEIEKTFSGMEMRL